MLKCFARMQIGCIFVETIKTKQNGKRKISKRNFIKTWLHSNR
jgi:hypothetical protein